MCYDIMFWRNPVYLRITCFQIEKPVLLFIKLVYVQVSLIYDLAYAIMTSCERKWAHLKTCYFIMECSRLWEQKLYKGAQSPSTLFRFSLTHQTHREAQSVSKQYIELNSDYSSSLPYPLSPLVDLIISSNHGERVISCDAYLAITYNLL